MLNRQRRREFEERIKKGTMNPGHLNSLTIGELVMLAQSCGVNIESHRRVDLVRALLNLNGNKDVKVTSQPTYNVTKEGLNSLIVECLNDPTNPATSRMREEISETLVVAMLFVLRNKYGFAQKRIDDFLKAFNDVTDGITSGKLSLAEMHKEIAKPYKDGKCNLKLRYEDSEVTKEFFRILESLADKVSEEGCPSCPYSIPTCAGHWTEAYKSKGVDK